MTDSERLDFLIEAEAYVRSAVWGYVVQRHVCEDEFENLSPAKETPREAIDAAMAKTTA